MSETELKLESLRLAAQLATPEKALELAREFFQWLVSQQHPEGP